MLAVLLHLLLIWLTGGWWLLVMIVMFLVKNLK